MELAVGYVFTPSLIADLSRRGFVFEQLNSIPGCHRFVCFLDSSNGTLGGFELREVVDEDLYFQGRQVRDFHPFLFVDPDLGGLNPRPSKEQKNSAFRIRSVMLLNELPAGELRQFLKIRKNFMLCALWLECGEWEPFLERAKPDKIFTHEKRQCSLIHLGPSCFDLVVTEKTE